MLATNCRGKLTEYNFRKRRVYSKAHVGMAWIPRAVIGFGLLLLIHACYSAQEHSALQSFRASTLLSSSIPTATSATNTLPIDIIIETIAATIVICIGLALNAPTLRPIRWRAWAGKIEREGPAGFRQGSGEFAKEFIGNPYRMLEARPGFVDIRRQRKEFAQWVKDNGSK